MCFIIWALIFIINENMRIIMKNVITQILNLQYLHSSKIGK